MITYDLKKLKRAAYYGGAHFDDWSFFFNQLNAGFSKTSRVHQILIENEIDDLYKILERNPILEYSIQNTDFSDKYKQTCDTVLNFFSSDIAFPNLYVVDVLPEPFDQKPWSSMSVDEKDSIELRIDQGIYFKHDSLLNPYFEIIIAHELIHWTISHFSSEHYLFTNLIEEGICDYLSYLIILKSKLVEEPDLVNFITFLRALKPANSIWHNYYKFSKLIQSMVSDNGIDYIINTVKGGREAVNSIDLRYYDHVNNENDIHVLTLDKCFAKADTSVVLDTNSYYLLQHLINNKITRFKPCDIYNLFPDQEAISSSLQYLVDSSFLGINNNYYYQSFMKMPTNLKFKIERC